MKTRTQNKKKKSTAKDDIRPEASQAVKDYKIRLNEKLTVAKIKIPF